MIPNKETRALARNLTTFDLWFEHLSLLAISSIEWTFPKTVDAIYVERELFYNTQVLTFVADDSLVALAGFGSSKPNLYGIPLKRIVNAKNGFTAKTNVAVTVKLTADGTLLPSIIAGIGPVLTGNGNQIL